MLIQYLDSILSSNTTEEMGKTNAEQWGLEVCGDEGQCRGGWLGRYLAGIGIMGVFGADEGRWGVMTFWMITLSGKFSFCRANRLTPPHSKQLRYGPEGGGGGGRNAFVVMT